MALRFPRTLCNCNRSNRSRKPFLRECCPRLFPGTELSKKSSPALFNPPSASCLKKPCVIVAGTKPAPRKSSIFLRRLLQRNSNPPASKNDYSALTPVCSATVPPVHTAASTLCSPTLRINSHNSSGRKNRATEDGKYLYAAASPEIAPPTFGNSLRKYQR